MKIRICSRKAIEKMAKEPFGEKTALISITDSGWTFAELKNAPEYLLCLAFDDVDNDIFDKDEKGILDKENRMNIERKYNMFSDEQARKIAEFYFKVKGKAENLICQCEHGQSRSAAVAAAIMEYRSRKGIEIFSNDNYFPNKVVFRKTLFALRELSYKKKNKTD